MWRAVDHLDTEYHQRLDDHRKELQEQRIRRSRIAVWVNAKPVMFSLFVRLAVVAEQEDPVRTEVYSQTNRLIA